MTRVNGRLRLRRTCFLRSRRLGDKRGPSSPWDIFDPLLCSNAANRAAQATFCAEKVRYTDEAWFYAAKTTEAAFRARLIFGFYHSGLQCNP